MVLHAALSYAGLAAALVLLAASQSRGIALVAVLAAALEVLMHLQVLQLHLAHVPLGLILALGLAVPSLVVWVRSTSKVAVSASAIAAFVGVVQLVGYALPRM
jgi:hypothetical protein